LTTKYLKEKERADEIWPLKQKLEELLSTLKEAEHKMDSAQLADILYGALKEIEVAIAKNEAATGENFTLTESVGPEQIAEVH
jgi:hypothetical protein